VLEDDAEALENLTETLMRDVPAGEPLPLARMAGQPRAVVRRALYWWLYLNEARENVNARAFDALLAAVLAAQPGRWSAGPGRWIMLDKAKLLLMGDETGANTPWGPFRLTAGQTVELPDGARLQTRRVAVDRKLLKDLREGQINPATQAFLALPKKSAGLVVYARSWQPGDRYRPLGAPGRRKLQDLFTDKKIPAKERPRRPVVCNGQNEPLWTPDFPPAHDLRVIAGTRAALGLTYSPPCETMNRLSVKL
jgi:tRNA(Ile)-lysidine synthase